MIRIKLKSKIFFIAILCFAFFTLAQDTQAKELYVNGATGNDATTYAQNDADHPWATIKRAAWGSTVCASKVTGEAAQAGDTVNVAAGTYAVTRDCVDHRAIPTYNPVNSGTAGNVITFLASGIVVLTQTGNAGPIIGADTNAYITWDGFYIDENDITTASDTGPVAIFGGDHITIQNCTVIGTGMSRWPDNHKGIAIQGVSSYIIIRNNKISNFYTYGVSTRNGCGIQIYNSAHFTIENNEIYDVGTGIFIKEGREYGYGNSIVRKNLIYNTSGGAGIEYNNWPNIAPTGEVKIYGNIIRDSDSGVYFAGNSTGEPNAPSYGKFVNNTIDNCTRGVKVNWTSYLLGNIFWNNIVTDSIEYAVFVYIDALEQGQDEHIGEETHIDFEHNLYYGFPNFAYVLGDKSLATGKSTYSQDSASPASFSSDPLYTDSGNNDFRLQGGSPAINAGVDILDLDDDGQTTDPIALGAYITGDEIIGVDVEPDVTPPAAPSGLSVS